ncbi:MAG: sulfite oxidase [Gemmatimonadetes bacterium]|nr:sulfite oxidase [Gemmatimonadota bacterium]
MPTRAIKDIRFAALDVEGLNGGVPASTQAGQPFTSPLTLFTRSHAAAPSIDPAEWRLSVTGLVDRPARFSLTDLERSFPIREVAATMICAGLRRREFLALGPLPGELPWGAEPAGTSRWRGVSLADVLTAVGVDPAAQHVEFTGLDQVERHGHRFGFGGSVPLDKARDPDVLLAFALDDAPLPRDHGFPVRVVVPGYIGARSVKWLAEIAVRREPSANYFQTKAYRVQRTPNPADPRDVSDGEALGSLPLNSVILTPEAEARVTAGPVEVAGWAIGPDGEAVDRVELSLDGGTTWGPTRLEATGHRWTWQLWRATADLAPGAHQIVVRAWDRRGRTQPARLSEVWNVKGYVNNAWHRVSVLATPGPAT